MKTKNREKKSYHAPVMEHIKLDNEISLILQSEDEYPLEDPWASINANFNDNPFKSNIT